MKIPDLGWCLMLGVGLGLLVGEFAMPRVLVTTEYCSTSSLPVLIVGIGLSVAAGVLAVTGRVRWQ